MESLASSEDDASLSRGEGEEKKRAIKGRTRSFEGEEQPKSTVGELPDLLYKVIVIHVTLALVFQHSLASYLWRIPRAEDTRS